MYLAHSANDAGVRHPLREHLSRVAALAAQFLEGRKGAEEAALAGLLHDLGKYVDLFQARLRARIVSLRRSTNPWKCVRVSMWI